MGCSAASCGYVMYYSALIIRSCVRAQKQILAATASTFGPQAGTFGPGGPSQVHHAAALLLLLTVKHLKVRGRCQDKDFPQRLGKATSQNGEALLPSSLPAPRSPLPLPPCVFCPR